MPPKPLSVTLVVLGAVLLACGPAGTTAPPPGDRATGLAQTAAAILTATAALITPPSPTATLTAVPSATVPPVPTITETVFPTQTLTPAPSPTPCENDSAFVSDLNVPDGTHFARGTPFVKTWRLRNDGTCTWTADYTFRYVGGDALSGAAINLPGAVPAGETVDLSVALVAPASNGTFRGEWQLHGPDDEPFGTTPYVEISVP